MRFSKERRFGLAEVMSFMTGICCYSVDFNLINSKTSAMITGHAKRISINNMQVQECQHSPGGFINEMRCFFDILNLHWLAQKIHWLAQKTKAVQRQYRLTQSPTSKGAQCSCYAQYTIKLRTIVYPERSKRYLIKTSRYQIIRFAD